MVRGNLNVSPVINNLSLQLTILDRFWAGWDDIEQEGFFANTHTGEVLQKRNGFWPFYPGEPNGELLENCAMVWTTRNAWNDLICTERMYTFCHIQTRDRIEENC